MRLKIFWGCAKDVTDDFNKWAELKQLTRDIIIHEHIYTAEPPEPKILILLFVYYPEGSMWDKEANQ